MPVKYVKAIRKVLKSSTWAVLNESLSRKCQKNRKTQALSLKSASLCRHRQIRIIFDEVDGIIRSMAMPMGD